MAIAVVNSSGFKHSIDQGLVITVPSELFAA